MTALPSEMFIFWMRSACKIQLVSYGSKYTSQPLLDTPLVHTSMHNLKTTGDMWLFCTSNNCSTMENIPSVVQNCMRSNWKIVHVLQACTCIAIWCIAIWCASTCVHHNKTHKAYDHTTHQTMALLTMHRFIRTDLGGYCIPVVKFHVISFLI